MARFLPQYRLVFSLICVREWPKTREAHFTDHILISISADQWICNDSKSNVLTPRGNNTGGKVTLVWKAKLFRTLRIDWVYLLHFFHLNVKTVFLARKGKLAEDVMCYWLCNWIQFRNCVVEMESEISQFFQTSLVISIQTTLNIVEFDRTVLGSDFWWAWYWRIRNIQRGFGRSARTNQCLLQWSYW